jgi:hypothetical protein
MCQFRLTSSFKSSDLIGDIAGWRARFSLDIMMIYAEVKDGANQPA